MQIHKALYKYEKNFLSVASFMSALKEFYPIWYTQRPVTDKTEHTDQFTNYIQVKSQCFYVNIYP